MSPSKALEYLKDVGIDISKRTYFRCKKKVEATKWQRLYRIAELFTDQHLQRIDRLELVESLMWKNYDAEKSPYKKVDILSFNCKHATLFVKLLRSNKIRLEKGD